jgi:hypothetical protein
MTRDSRAVSTTSLVIVQAVDLQDAGYLVEQAVHEAEVAAGDAGDRGGAERLVLVHEPGPAVELG